MMHALRNVSLAIAIVLLCTLPSDSLAQLRGAYPPGFAALASGTQGPPGIDIVVPAFIYTSDDIRDDNGHRLAITPRITSVLLAGSVSWVTNVKLLGANLGGMLMPLPFLRNSIEGRSLDVAGNFAYSDIFFEPFQLGWHPKPADFLVGYSIVIPTGKYSFGSPTNAGLGMVGNLFQAGTTVRLDKTEPWEFSVLSTFATHGKKRGTDIKVGNVLTLEGGLGYAFYKKQKQKHPIPIDVGLVYYGQFKLTSDRVNGDRHPGVQTLLAGRKDRVYALGGELDYFIPPANLVLGAHALNEFGARNRTQGVTMMFSIGWMAASFAKKVAPNTHGLVRGAGAEDRVRWR